MEIDDLERVEGGTVRVQPVPDAGDDGLLLGGKFRKIGLDLHAHIVNYN